MEDWGISEIERAFRLFHSSDGDAMCIDHSSFQTGMPQKLLNDSNIVIGLEEVRGEGMTEGMGLDPFRNLRFTDGIIKRLLKVRFMEMVTPAFSGLSYHRQIFLREKPLLNVFLRRIGILRFHRVIQEYPVVSGGQVLFTSVVSSPGGLSFRNR